MDRNVFGAKATQHIDVALRKESVDRNSLYLSYDAGYAWSLSARRAWIEMYYMALKIRSMASRSPQGERG